MPPHSIYIRLGHVTWFEQGNMSRNRNLFPPLRKQFLQQLMSQDKKICDRLGHEVGRICNNQELDFSCYMFLRLWVHLLLLHKLATLIESVSFSLYFDFLRQHFDHRASYIFPPNFNLKHLRKFSSGLQNIKTNQFFILKIS